MTTEEQPTEFRAAQYLTEALARPRSLAESRLHAEAARTYEYERALKTQRAKLAETLHEARKSGMTLQAIGDVLGLSRQRVKQLLDR